VLKTAATLVKPAAVIVVLVLVFVGYRALVGSRLFELHRVIVNDASPDLSAHIEQTVKRLVGETRLLNIDLAALKKKVEAVPRVRSAIVSRALPDAIFVRVTERKPAALVLRESGAIVWLDEEAVEMGEYNDFKAESATFEPGDGQTYPPIAKGFAEGTRSPAAIADDRERIAVYRRLEQDFSEGPPKLWNSIDHIDLSSTKDVNLEMAKSSVTIHVGSSDFRRRFERALQVLEAIKQGDVELLNRLKVQNIELLIANADNIAFMDAARPDRVVVTFAAPGAQKAARQETSQKQAPKKK
jgi:cell division septal protein FtsQ